MGFNFREAAKGPQLGFEHEEVYNGGSKRPDTHTLHGVHPETGERVGWLKYDVPKRKADKIYVQRMEIHPEHRGNGYANQLMDEMQQRHPGTPIDHGDRTTDGQGWWNSYTQGKSVRKGRTIAALEEDDDAGSVDRRGSDLDQATGPQAPEAVAGDETPAACSYCGSTEFEGLTDNGRVRQATCSACGGTMSAHDGAQWTPELIGDPSNHPKPDADPRSGGVGGAAAVGMDPIVRDTSRLAIALPAPPHDPDTLTPEEGKEHWDAKQAGFAGWVGSSKDHTAEHQDPELHYFLGRKQEDDPNEHLWRSIKPTHVSLKQPIYATQPGVDPHGVHTYLNNKYDRGRHVNAYPDEADDYHGNEMPAFVKHEGRMHVVEGHHRTSAEILRGSPHIRGRVYDADERGFPHQQREWHQGGAIALSKADHEFVHGDASVTERGQHLFDALPKNDRGDVHPSVKSRVRGEYERTQAGAEAQVHKTPDPEHATPFMVHINEYTEQPQGISWRAPGSSEWQRHDLANHKTGKLTEPEMHEVLTRFGHDHRTGGQQYGREHSLTPVKHAGFRGYVDGYEGHHEDMQEADHALGGHESHQSGGDFDEELYDRTAPDPTTHERHHYEDYDEWPEEYHERHDEAYGQALQQKKHDVKPIAHHGGVFHMLSIHGENDYKDWHDKGELKDVNLHEHPVFATQPHVVDRHINRYLKNPHDIVDHVHQHGLNEHNDSYPGTHHPMFIKHEGNLFTVEGHHRTAAALLRNDSHIKAHVYDADKHGFPHSADPDDDEYGEFEHGTGLHYASLQGGGACDFTFDDALSAMQHSIRHHDDGVCTLTEAHRHKSTRKTAAVDGPDWCTWRHAAQCTFPNDRNNTLLAIPQVRGACPWNTRYAQQICPISEPGPQALMSVKGSASPRFTFTPGEGRTHDHLLELHHGDKQVGHIKWNPDDGHLSYIETHPDHRRQGIGSQLWSKADELSDQQGTPRPTHSVFWTGDGSALRENRKPVDVSHIPTEVSGGIGSGETDVRKHMIEGHGFRSSADMINKMPEEDVHSWHDKIKEFDRCGFQRQASTEDDYSYRMQHQAPDAEDGSPLHDLSANGTFPADVYTHPHYYDTGHADYYPTHSKIRAAQGNPEKKIRIYRALPAEHAHKGFLPGDWVSTSKEYARDHGRHHEDSKHDWPVISTTVPAKHLHTDGDLMEWGYNGEHKPGSVAFKGGYHQEISQRSDGSVRPVQRKAKSPERQTADKLKENGYSFSHFRPPAHEENGEHQIAAYGPDDNWAGMIRGHGDGSVHHVEIDPEHKHMPLEEHMRNMLKQGSASLSVPQSYELARVARQDPEMAFHVTAAWSDVRNKAKRIRAEGKVMIKAATNEGLAGMVEGDHGTYENMITYRPGSRKIADWSCNCKWGEWAWDRIRFHGRQCSHSLALQYEAQSRGMFGREVHLGALTFKADEAPKPLPTGENFFYRLHHPATPFGPEHAQSYGMHGDDEPQKGYSTFRNPHDLHHYMHEMDWVDHPDVDWPERNVIGFHGTESGKGLDHEPLAIPHGNAPDVHMGWDEFEDRLRHTPGQPSWSMANAYRGSLRPTPIQLIARSLIENDEDPGDIMKLLMAYGLPHSGALQMIAEAEEHRRKCPFCGGGLSEKAIEAHKCPHCGHPIGHVASANMTEAEEDERRKRHHHTNDTRRHAPEFGRGVPAWIPLPIGWCSQCRGWGCGHCGGTGQVAQDGYGHDANAVPDQNGDEGQMMQGGISDTSSLRTTSFNMSPVDAVYDSGNGRGSHSKDSSDGFLSFAAGAASANETNVIGSELRMGSTALVPVADVVGLGAGDQVGQVLAGRGIAGVPEGFTGISHMAGESPTMSTHHAGRSGFGVGAVPEQSMPGMLHGAQPGMAGVGTAGSVDLGFVARFDADGLAASADARTLRHDVHASNKKSDGPTVSGVALKAADTGRVLMLQRGLGEDHPAAGKWEFPGGHHEPGDTTSLHAGIREFEEEVGQPFPEGGTVHHTWTSPDGVYQGHVVVIPSEKDLRMHEGRVVPNPDDPKGDEHEQAAWWDIDHAKGNKVLRDEVRAHTPWKDIANAGMQKAASAWDPLTGEGETPGFPYAAPLHSNSKNPGSTGFATSEDPKSWTSENEIPDHLLPSSSYDSGGTYYGMLHDEPEPALPSTDGADPEDYQPPETHGSIADVEESLSPNQFTGSVTEIVAAFQATAGAKGIMAKTPASTPGGGDVSFDFAAAARQYLAQDKGMQKSALKDFSFPEQQELINEGKREDVRARNFSNLQIEGTHYEALGKALGLEDEDAEGIFS